MSVNVASRISEVIVVPANPDVRRVRVCDRGAPGLHERPIIPSVVRKGGCYGSDTVTIWAGKKRCGRPARAGAGGELDLARPAPGQADQCLQVVDSKHLRYRNLFRARGLRSILSIHAEPSRISGSHRCRERQRLCPRRFDAAALLHRRRARRGTRGRRRHALLVPAGHVHDGQPAGRTGAPAGRGPGRGDADAAASGRRSTRRRRGSGSASSASCRAS